MSKIAGLSELQLIYKFLDEHDTYVFIDKFGGEYRVGLQLPENDYYPTLYEGATISDAIRCFYEAQEKAGK
jgi:hypothetical protein